MKYLVQIIIITSIIFTALSAQEKNAVYYNKLGWEQLDKGDYLKAILTFKEALTQNPQYLKAMVGLGKCYLHTEAYSESLKLFNSALKIDNDNIESINGIGFNMIGLGRYNDALLYFDRTLKISEENLRAKFGIAYVYFLMDKTIWAKRKVDNILKINPYHYQSLLLLADIKSLTGRTREAKEYIQKAIDSNNKLPDAYIKYGLVYLKEYKKSNNIEDLNNSVQEFNKALAIHPENLLANRYLGYVSLLQEDHEKASLHFKKALESHPKNGTLLYNLSLSYEKHGQINESLKYFLMALKTSPADSILRAKLEDFLVLHNFAVGHPLRIKFSNEHLEIAVDNLRKNLLGDAILHLQRSLLLNPMNRTARERLRDNYLTRNFYRFYVGELKILNKLYYEKKYKDLLNVAIIKRRDKLYQKAGFSDELPARDVPNVLVLNFWPYNETVLHPDAGEVFANYLAFALNQFGRMRPIGVKKRIEISSKLKPGRVHFADTLEKLTEMKKGGDIRRLDYIVFGTFREGVSHLTINCELLDFNTGVIISNFSLNENNSDNIQKLSLRASKKLYDIIPFKGRILKTDTTSMIVNLGLFDGIKPGDLLEIYKLNSPDKDEKLNIKKKILLVVEESDTLISSVKPLKLTNTRFININDLVYPFKKKRSKLLE